MSVKGRLHLTRITNANQLSVRRDSKARMGQGKLQVLSIFPISARMNGYFFKEAMGEIESYLNFQLI